MRDVERRRKQEMRPLSYREGNPFFYYLVLLIGMGFLGSYGGALAALSTEYTFFHIVMYTAGVVLVLSTLALASATSRRSRLSLTTVSGLSGGVHSYLLLAVFSAGAEGFSVVGIVLFAWLMAGLLFAFAAFSWTRQL